MEPECRTEGTAKRVSRSYVQHVTAPPAEVFPLLCPVRERDWIEGWEAALVYSKSGFAEEGCVFTTAREGEPETVWTITRHDRSRYEIEFVMVTPGSRVGQLHIALTGEPDGTTACRVTYTYTALGPDGERFVDAFSEAAYRDKMIAWERAINHYLTTGTMLSTREP